MSNNQHQHEMAVALEVPPSIFKLDVDCFEELFDWLSLKDLSSFGQTCKRMQQVAGHFFRLKYHAAEVICFINGIYCNDVKINGFSDCIENITINEHYYLRFANSNEFKLLKKIIFNRIEFDDERIAFIKKFLGKVEIVEIVDCSFSVDFYDKFLRYCINMKCLHVKNYNVKFVMGYNWLLEHYPRLEQLILNVYDLQNRLDELTTFFTRNPNVQHFAARQRLLQGNQHSLIASNVKLETLSILCGNANKEFRKMLKEFREREVYKQLHLYVFHFDNGLPDIIKSLSVTKSVEKFTYHSLPSFSFVNLKELVSHDVRDVLDVETVASALVNIERIRFWDPHPNQIIAFIRRSRKLSHIAIQNIRKFEGNILDLSFWHTERGKLAGARKVTVYVNEEVFLETKMATQNKDYRLIEIKRLDSHCWNMDFSHFSMTI